MKSNPIEEIKRIRHEMGAAVDYDVSRIFAELREEQARSDRTYINPPKPSVADRQLRRALQGTEEA